MNQALFEFINTRIMKKILFILFITSSLLHAQVTLKVTSIPSNTPAGFKLYVAGSFNNWDPMGTLMAADGLGSYTCVIPEGTGTAEYKFTRGTWPTVEGNASGQYLPNRTFTFKGTAQTLNLTILTWEDMGTGSSGTAASNVRVLNNSFLMPQLNRSRKIWIYLPPDYETSTKRYPVLYMQDGQNLFDNATSFAGEWQVDETLNSLFSKGDYGAIVVGIDNGGGSRIDEYTPWNNPQYGGGEGDQYVQFMAETLKPYVDLNYRTRPQAEYNALIGSSLGSLISTYAGVKYSNVFSKIGSLSPAYWIVLSQLGNYITSSTSNLSNMRIYFVAGTTESSTIQSDINSVKNNLQSKGLTVANTLVKMDSYGQHNENYWKGEFGATYQWLFKNTSFTDVSTDTKDVSLNKLSVYFSNNQLYLKGIERSSEAAICDFSGRLVERITLNNGWNNLRSNLHTGYYILKLQSSSISFQVI